MKLNNDKPKISFDKDSIYIKHKMSESHKDLIRKIGRNEKVSMIPVGEVGSKELKESLLENFFTFIYLKDLHRLGLIKPPFLLTSEGEKYFNMIN